MNAMNLISKKDLLALTGISYGQLYRWKRQQLIPEEWFIKQASYTGQETFFPRQQILSRVQSILELKDQFSMDEMARVLSPDSKSTTLTLDSLAAIEEIDPALQENAARLYGREQFDFSMAVELVIVSEASRRASLTSWQKQELARRMISASASRKRGEAICVFFKVDREYHVVFTQNGDNLSFDSEINMLEPFSLSEMTGKLKAKYRNLL